MVKECFGGPSDNTNPLPLWTWWLGSIFSLCPLWHFTNNGNIHIATKGLCHLGMDRCFVCMLKQLIQIFHIRLVSVCISVMYSLRVQETDIQCTVKTKYFTECPLKRVQYKKCGFLSQTSIQRNYFSSRGRD